MTNTLSAKITVDVVELQAKAAVARAELSATTSEMNKLARAAAASGTGQITPDLLKAAQAAGTARTQLNELTGQLEKAGVHVTGLREIGSTLHELASGDLSRLPISFARLSETFGEVSEATLAGVGAVTALGAGLAYLSEQAIKSIAAVQGVELAFAFHGLAQSSNEVERMVTEIRGMGASAADAEKVGRALAGIRDGTSELRNAVERAIPELAQGLGVDLPKAAEVAVGLFNDLSSSGLKFLQDTGASAAQLTRFNEAIADGHRGDAMVIMLAQIATVTARVRDEAKNSEGAWSHFMESLVGSEGNVLGIAEAFKKDAEALKELQAAAQVNPTTKPIGPPSSSELTVS